MNHLDEDKLRAKYNESYLNFRHPYASHLDTQILNAIDNYCVWCEEITKLELKLEFLKLGKRYLSVELKNDNEKQSGFVDEYYSNFMEHAIEIMKIFTDEIYYDEFFDKFHFLKEYMIHKRHLINSLFQLYQKLSDKLRERISENDYKNFLKKFEEYCEHLNNKFEKKNKTHQKNKKNNEISEKTVEMIIDKYKEKSEEKVPINKENYVFRKELDSWIIIYNGKNYPLLKDLKGLKYIQFLIERPFDEIFICDLCDEIEGREVSNTEKKSPILRSSFKNEKDTPADALNLTDSRSENNISLERSELEFYRKRLRQLSNDRAKAEDEKDKLMLDEIDNETKKIKRVLTGKKDDKGNMVKWPRQLKKDYDRVNRNINTVYKQLSSNVENNELHQHLLNTIHIGRNCQYSPEKEISWNS